MTEKSEKTFNRWVRKYPLAALSGLLLAILLIVSIFGSTLLPDKTPYANRQITELPLKKAFTKATLLIQDQTVWPVTNVVRQDKNISGQRIISSGGETIPFEVELSDNVNLENITFFLGTDALGRDLFSRLMTGVKISLFIGFFAVAVSLIIGIIIGLVAGYYGGWADRMLTIFINSMWSIPTILLVFALVLAFGRGVENIILAIGLTMWIDIARLVRGMAKAGKGMAYIESTVALAYSDLRIIGRHLFPNMINPLIILATTNFATAILVEAGISYLGFGIKPPAPSVGIILSENYAYILGGHYLKSLAPAAIIILMVLSLNLLGTALKDTLEQSLSKAAR